MEEKARFYLVEEMIEGCDLAQLLTEYVPRADPYIAARALHHLAKGIAASHHVNVVHRDLKPSNVMVVGGPSVASFKITDFGIAKMAEKEIGDAVEGGTAGLTASQTALGALPYMAPEMIEDLKQAGKPADIWALGAMTLELLTGTRPFGQGYKAVPAIMKATLPELPKNLIGNPQYSPLAKEIYQIVQECMKKDPDARLTADQVVEACEALCYSVSVREFGTVNSLNFGKHGFIRNDDPKKSDVFFHVDSVYGATTVTVGQRVWFSRFPGAPRDRAFPVVPAVSEASF